MKRRRNLLVALLLVCAMGIGVGYAALTTDLTINGTAQLEAIEGQVYFSKAELSGSVAEIAWNGGEPTVGEGTKDLTFSIKGFDAVGEKATVAIEITNPHDFAVKIKGLTVAPEFDATSINGTKYFSFTNTLANEQVIPAGGKHPVTIVITCDATNDTDAAITDQFKVSFQAEACVSPTP